MTAAFKVLVVCHANVARSVAAAHFLEGAVDENGTKVLVRSAGTHATEDQAASGRTRTAIDSLGGEVAPLGAHRAHLLDDDDVAWADLVIAMEASQVRFIRRTIPDGAPRTTTISAVAFDLSSDGLPLRERVEAMHLAQRDDADADDVIDPAGGDDAVYAATIDTIAQLCDRVIARFAGCASD